MPSATPPADPSSIDEFEDGNTQLLKRGGRNGYWFTSAGNPDDALAMITAPVNAQLIVAPEPAGDANDTKKAAHVVATAISPDDGAHAELGVNFVNPASGETLAPAYPDAGTYIGISFRARVGDDAAETTQVIRFAVPTTETAADSDHYAKDVTVTQEWEQYFVQWADADFMQQGFGAEATFSAAEATGLQFKLVSPAESLDLWVDDIAFIPAAQ